MATLYRCINDDDNIVVKQDSDADEARMLANEVLDMIKTSIGADVFLDSYNKVRADVLAQRNDRKQQRSIMVCVSPLSVFLTRKGCRGSRSTRKA